jgi:hypothetical protein
LDYKTCRRVTIAEVWVGRREGKGKGKGRRKEGRGGRDGLEGDG